jgi:hypothetical protein
VVSRDQPTAALIAARIKEQEGVLEEWRVEIKLESPFYMSPLKSVVGHYHL